MRGNLDAGRFFVLPPIYVRAVEVLRGLQLQMEHCDYLHILRILRLSQSIFVKQLNDLGAEITAELDRMADNMRYLQLLVKPCGDLNRLASPAELPPRLKEVMHVMRVIWTNAKYFNTRDQMTLLFRCLSNQIIIFGQTKIDVRAILLGRPREGLRIGNLTIDCLLAYRLIYDYVKQFHVDAAHPIGWDLDEPAIFNHVDTFQQRLMELLEFCNAIIVFGRTDETEVIPAPLFGGIRGPEFEETARIVEQKYQRGLVKVQNSSSHLLDVHSTEWAQVAANYRQLVRELEEIVENLITNVFVSVSNVEEGLEALWALYYFSKRTNLRPAYLRKTADVWLMFAAEMDTTNMQLLEQVSMRRVWQPALAGRASSLRLNLERLRRFRDMFVRAEWLPDSGRAAPTLAAFDDMERSLTKNGRELYEQWLDAVETDCTGRLNQTLMKRSVRKPGQLECNIDFTVLDLCEEARYFEMMGFGIPGHIRAIYGKYETLKLVFDSVVSVVQDYNRILDALSPDERKLFAALITMSERRVKPGLYKLTWASENIDAYVADCVKQSRKLQAFVDEYKTANKAMMRACERICDTTLIRLGGTAPGGRRDVAVQLEQLRAEVEDGRQQATVELVQLYGDVVDMVMVVYQGFESQMENVSTDDGFSDANRAELPHMPTTDDRRVGAVRAPDRPDAAGGLQAVRPPHHAQCLRDAARRRQHGAGAAAVRRHRSARRQDRVRAQHARHRQLSGRHRRCDRRLDPAHPAAGRQVPFAAQRPAGDGRIPCGLHGRHGVRSRQASGAR